MKMDLDLLGAMIQGWIIGALITVFVLVPLGLWSAFH
jgi:hypothetical protein